MNTIEDTSGKSAQNKQTALIKNVQDGADLIRNTLQKWYFETAEAYYFKLLKEYESRISELLEEGVVPDEAMAKEIAFIKAFSAGELPEDLVIRDLLMPAALNAPDWASRVKEYYGPMSAKCVELRDISRKLLNRPEAIGSEHWPQLVKDFIDCSETYAVISEDVYGEAMEYDDDEEGPLREEWAEGGYSTLGMVFSTILSTKEAAESPAFKDLFCYALDAQLRYDFYPEEKIMSVLMADHVHRMEDWDELIIHLVQVQTKCSLYRQWVDELLDNPMVKSHPKAQHIREVVLAIWTKYLNRPRQ